MFPGRRGVGGWEACLGGWAGLRGSKLSQEES